MDRRHIIGDMLAVNHSSGRLPTAYQEVEWIESHDEEYIDTLVIPELSTDFYIKFMFTGLNDVYNRVFGVAGITDGSIGIRSSESNGGKIYFEKYGKYIQTSYDLAVNVIYEIALDNYVLSINGTDIGSVHPMSVANTINIFLFGHNSKTKIELSKIRVLNFKLKDSTISDSYIRNFVPCFRKSDGVIGMYDICGSICTLTNTPFYINAGTGTFTKGANVN